MIKTTEYDLPDELLDLAGVTEIKQASQPVYNGDLAEVVSQAMEQVPTLPGRGKNREMDADLFETVETDGDFGVTLKDGSITNEYLAEKAVENKNIARHTIRHNRYSTFYASITAHTGDTSHGYAYLNLFANVFSTAGDPIWADVSTEHYTFLGSIFVPGISYLSTQSMTFDWSTISGNEYSGKEGKLLKFTPDINLRPGEVVFISLSPGMTVDDKTVTVPVKSTAASYPFICMTYSDDPTGYDAKENDTGDDSPWED